MLQWICIAVLTAAAILAVLLPLGRPPALSGTAEQARRVYLDQLDELKRDLQQGRIGEAEASAARAEIARRLIASETDAASPPLMGGNRLARRATAVAGLVGIPALALGLYLALGAPNLPGQPLAARLATPAAATDIEGLLARVQRHLEVHPDDGRGWEVIAPVYARLGRTEEAAGAYRNAIRLLGPSAARQGGLGAALVAAQGGIVTADARGAFDAALAADPKAVEPRYFLGLAAEQDGRRDEAAATWRGLLADAPADAPWRKPVQEGLARLESKTAGPSAEQVAAAGAMATDDRSAMIEGMVAGLAERLQSHPDDADGWMKLIRSYTVLGRNEDAAGAAEAALRGVTAPEGRERVATLIADLGLQPAGALTP